MYHLYTCNNVISYNCTDPVEKQNEIESKSYKQGQEPKVVEVTRKVVL